MFATNNHVEFRYEISTNVSKISQVNVQCLEFEQSCIHSSFNLLLIGQCVQL